MNDRPQRNADERLADWVDGRMSDKERERFVAELRVNPQLREDLERYERTVGVVRAALRAPGASAGIADRVMAAINAKSGPSARAEVRAPAGRRVAWSIAAAAAVLTLAFWIDAWSPGSPATHDTAGVEPPAEAGTELDAEAPAIGVFRDAAPGAEEPPAVPKAVEGEVVDEVAVMKSLQQAARAPSVAPTAPPPEQTTPEGRAEQAPPPESGAKAGTPLGRGAPSGPTAPAPRGPTTGGPGGPATGGPIPGNPSTGDRVIVPSPDAETASPRLGKTAYDEPAAAAKNVSVPMIVVEGAVVAPPVTTALRDGAKDKGAARGGSAPGSVPGSAEKERNQSEPVRAQPDAARVDDADGADAPLDAKALAASIDLFLAGAAAPESTVAAMHWTTASGALRLSPVVDAPAGDAPVVDAPASARGDKERGATATKSGVARGVTRTWLVEGGRDDVEVLLGRLARFAQEHKLTRRSGETIVPADAGEERKRDAANEERSEGSARIEAGHAQQGADIRQREVQPEFRRVVLSFRLQAR